MVQIRIVALSAVAALGLAGPALAAADPSTRVVACGTGSCLQVSGHRDSPAAVVLINGHAVEVQGERKWRTSLPVETIRTWSEPLARTIDVATFDPATQRRTAAEADLPIGLLGHSANLATLVISVK
jgi:hypothetical protein